MKSQLFYGILFTVCVSASPKIVVAADGSNSRGGLFIEPALTFERGDTAVNYPSPLTSSSGRADGLGIGARIGFHLSEVLFMGFDGRYSMPQFKDSSVQYDAKAVATNWGPVIGLQMPDLGIRVWGSYILAGELNPEASGGFDVKFQNAKGYRAGVGFRVASLSINLEYQDLKYDKSTLEQIGQLNIGTTFEGVNLQDKKWLASVSFPMEF